MFFRKKLIIAEHQRVLVYKNQLFDRVLMPGKHKILDIKNELTFVTFDINSLYFTEKNAERLYRNHSEIAEHISHWQLTNNEVGLLYVNDLLRGVVAPSEHLYVWKDAGQVRLEKLSMEQDIALDEKTLCLINRAGANTSTRLIKSERTVAIAPVADFTIAQEHIGLLYVDGELMKTLTAGQYGFWQFNHKVQLKTFDCRVQMIEITGQEILSKDRVSLRINLTASIKIENAKLAVSSIENVNDYVYKSLQLALREAVGTKSLDDILLDKLYINETVKELVLAPLNELGISLLSVGVKDIILPGEMKAILNQVVEAEKAAEANVIKRREETSATRSLHNTAKVIENNPTLMRLKELEALEKVAESIDSLTVYDGLNGLVNGVVKI